MNLARSLRASLLIFVLVEETISLKEVALYKDNIDAPLALIKKRGSSKLKLAIPHKYTEDSKLAGYSFDDDYDSDDSEDSEEQTGPREEFKIACPAYYPTETEIENKWKEKNIMPEHSKLFFSEKLKLFRDLCVLNAAPSIKRADLDSDGDVQYCGPFKAQSYDVGYPVSNEDGSNIQFISIYKICNSMARHKGTLYSIHRIVSPSLLLEKLWEFYELNPEVAYPSSLDQSVIDDASYKKHYVYQFVGLDDMPTKVWEITTLFSFNYFLIPKNKDLLKGMIAVDNYIRLFSKETNQPLTLYSGTYQTFIQKSALPCFHNFCAPKAKLVNSFWRIITNNEGLAVIIVTQHTLMKCTDQTYICHENRVIVKVYGKGGCTYTCSINGALITSLGLPSLPIRGVLGLTLPEKISKEAIPQNGKTSADGQSSKYLKFNITDFVGKSFMSVLTSYDPILASTVQLQNMSNAGEHGYADGTHATGDAGNDGGFSAFSGLDGDIGRENVGGAGGS